MTVKGEAFKKMRLTAMKERKDRILKNTNAEVTTLNEIAEQLRRTSMVNGKLFPLCLYIQL
jgi:hypothetical protein